MDPDDDDLTIFESISQRPELRKDIEEASNFLDKVQQGYEKDPLFIKIVTEPERYLSLCIGTIYYVHIIGENRKSCVSHE